MSDVQKWAKSPQGSADLAELRTFAAFRRFAAQLTTDAAYHTRAAIAPGAVPNGREYTAGYAAALSDLVTQISTQPTSGD